MTVHIEERAKKQLRKLPKHIQQKTYRQLDVFLDNPKHPSLAIKKMTHSPLYEARIDYHYRFRFLWENEAISIVSIGIHDTGLGKK